MKIALVGAGFSGLSLAWHLIDSRCCSVTLFDAKGIGAGASGMAAGLMHPYPGKQAKRSFLAAEGMAATQRLLRIAQSKSAFSLSNEKGIIRYSQNAEMHAAFLAHAEQFDDVEPYGPAFLIRSGMTIFCKRYLGGLWLAAQEKGVKFACQKIHSLDALSSFDHIVLTAGSGISTFQETKELRLEFLKGQLLKCAIPETLDFPEQSLIGDGYIAHSEEQGFCLIGSTYERGEFTEDPDWEKTKTELIPKAMHYYPQAQAFTIIDCQAAVRVMRIGHYYPMAGRLNERLWVCTALGSRGLLYHGILGEYLKEAILKDDPTVIPKEFHPSMKIKLG